jgi:hypothetical protein
MKASEIEHRRTKKVADTEVSAVKFLFPHKYFINYKVKVNQMQSFTGKFFIFTYLNIAISTR